MPADIEVLAADLKKATDEVKKFAETAAAEIKNLGKVTEETKAKADEALTTMNTKAAELAGKANELDARVTDLEQKAARRSGATADEMKTLGQRVLESEEFKSMLSQGSQYRGQSRVTVEKKTVSNLTTGTTLLGSGVSPTNSLVMADRQALVNLPDRRMVVRDLITPGQTNSNNIEYPVETSFQNMAAVTAEGAAKPQSDLAFDLKSAPVRTIAHWMKASRQIMDDAPALQSYIDGRLRFGLQFVEEAEILYGDGTGQHLLGIIPQATAYSAAFTPTGETAIDRLRLASLQATLALYPSTGYVLHPTDWAKIEITKDGQGRYIIGDPTGQVAPRLWGLPVVATQALTAGTFLTGAFLLGAQIFDRMAIEVLISTEDADNFTKNMITIRGEERIALAVYRPAAFVAGSLP